MKRTMVMGMLLGVACAHGEPFDYGSAGDLQEQYTDRKEDIDDCMTLFGDCLGTTEDNAGISECAEALQICLEAEPEDGDGMGLPGEDEDQDQPQDGDEDDPDADPEDDPMDPEGDDDPEEGDDDAVGEICDPILQACLDDPSQFDPFCLDDFEECVAVEVALELQDLCEDVQAQCLELDIPNFDCFELCS